MKEIICITLDTVALLICKKTVHGGCVYSAVSKGETEFYLEISKEDYARVVGWAENPVATKLSIGEYILEVTHVSHQHIFVKHGEKEVSVSISKITEIMLFA